MLHPRREPNAEFQSVVGWKQEDHKHASKQELSCLRTFVEVPEILYCSFTPSKVLNADKVRMSTNGCHGANAFRHRVFKTPLLANFLHFYFWLQVIVLRAVGKSHSFAFSCMSHVDYRCHDS